MPTLVLSQAEWEEVCEAVDFRAGGSDVAAELWPKLMKLQGPVVITEPEIFIDVKAGQ